MSSIVSIGAANVGEARVESSRIRTAIVVDAACDLPPQFFDDVDVAVLPIRVRIGRTTYVDQHDPSATEQFMRDDLGNRGADIETAPMTAAEIAKTFLERFVIDYDSIYCLTISALRSGINDNANEASALVARSARALRQNAGNMRPFQLRIIDTKSGFAGQGISALQLRDLLARGVNQAEIRARLFEVIDATHGFLLPDDLYYLRARARAKGDRSVSLLGATLGSALDIKPIVRVRHGDTSAVAKIRGREHALRRLFRYCARQVQRGLLSPHFCVSYGGPLMELRQLPGYAELALACFNESVELHESTMSITGMVNVGQRAVSVGFAAAEHSVEI